MARWVRPNSTRRRSSPCGDSEAAEAAASIGAVFHESICADLDIFYDRATLASVASVMRLVAPDIVLTHSPVDYMEDHTNACRLAVTAAFSRGMPNFPVTPPRPPIMKPLALYHAQPYSNRDPLRRLVTPDFYVDVTDREEDKVAMLAKHVSQKQWLDESQGLDSYLQTLRDLDAEVGRMSRMFPVRGRMAAAPASGIRCRAVRSLARGPGQPHR